MESDLRKMLNDGLTAHYKTVDAEVSAQVVELMAQMIECGDVELLIRQHLTTPNLIDDKYQFIAQTGVRVEYVPLRDMSRLKAENKRLRDALIELHAVQNGAPLLRDEKRWQAAMDAAEKLIPTNPNKARANETFSKILVCGNGDLRRDSFCRAILLSRRSRLWRYRYRFCVRGCAD